jgi:plastocyanin
MRFKNLVSSLLLTALVGLGCGGGGTTYGSGTAGSGGSTGSAGSGGAGGATFMAIDPCASMTSYATGMTTITTTADFKYSPACLKVTAGTMVTIQGSTTHPLVGLTTGSGNSPIPPGPSTMDQMVTFTTPGFYPFHCDLHFSIGMSGVVWVQ